VPPSSISSTPTLHFAWMALFTLRQRFPSCVSSFSHRLLLFAARNSALLPQSLFSLFNLFPWTSVTFFSRPASYFYLASCQFSDSASLRTLPKKKRYSFFSESNSRAQLCGQVLFERGKPGLHRALYPVWSPQSSPFGIFIQQRIRHGQLSSLPTAMTGPRPSCFLRPAIQGPSLPPVLRSH